jgi:imidazoleglycerol-phosphate dehydratase
MNPAYNPYHAEPTYPAACREDVDPHALHVDFLQSDRYNPARERGKLLAGRTTALTRRTKETDISVTLNPDSYAEGGVISTGVGFFDHILTAFSFHGGMSLAVKASGDLQVDAHHVVEDTGLVVGDALAQILAKGPVRRFGHAVIPMDEALSEVSVDVSGRPCLVYRASFPQPKVGDFDLCLLREFLMAFSSRARISLHAETRYGENSHHMAEALFKALGKAVASAYIPADGTLSTKGSIG